jgi:hypothetical protein
MFLKSYTDTNLLLHNDTVSGATFSKEAGV